MRFTAFFGAVMRAGARLVLLRARFLDLLVLRPRIAQKIQPRLSWTSSARHTNSIISILAMPSFSRPMGS
jgi:hypothetical protein